jgi:hypothetical protein
MELSVIMGSPVSTIGSAPSVLPTINSRGEFEVNSIVKQSNTAMIFFMF